MIEAIKWPRRIFSANIENGRAAPKEGSPRIDVRMMASRKIGMIQTALQVALEMHNNSRVFLGKLIDDFKGKNHSCYPVVR